MKKRAFSSVLALAMVVFILQQLVPMSGTALADTVAKTVSNWGIHNYVGADGTKVVTNYEAKANGDITISGDQTAGCGGIGATYIQPIMLNKTGFSVELSLDTYPTESTDKWFAVSILDKPYVTNGKNTDPVFKHWDDQTQAAAEGRGFVILLRPEGDGKLTVNTAYVGVTSASDATPKDGQWVYPGDGAYDHIKLSNYSNIKISLVKRANGGYNLVFNDGKFERLDWGRAAYDEGGINPDIKYTLIDQIFAEGTPGYVNLAAKNNTSAQMQFTINRINGNYANLANTLESWGVHNFTAKDGSPVVNEITATDLGEIKINGNQSAGDGGVGVTYNRAVNMSDGFSIEFSLDQFAKHGVNGTDSWFALQITDKQTITDARNTTGVFRRFEAGDPTYGSGLVMLLRPLDGNRLGVGEIYWNGVKINGSTVSKEQAFDFAASGCYDQIQLDSFQNIKIAFVKRAEGGYTIRFNDGKFTRVGADRLDRDNGGINPDNAFTGLETLFPNGTPAYVSLAYHDNVGGGTATQFRIEKFNEQQAAPNTENSWGAHSFTDISGSQIATDIANDGNNGIVVTGTQTAGDGGIGVTYKRPLTMTEGFSVEFSLDQFRYNGVNGQDSWFAFQLTDKQTITDARNTTPVFRRFEAGNPTYGSGIVILMRPLENNRLGIGEIMLNGVKINGEVVTKEQNFAGMADGCYSQIQLDSFKHIKVTFVRRPEGGFILRFNDGQFIRVGDNRLSRDQGGINVDNSFNQFDKIFPYGSPAYFALAYHDNTPGGAPCQFTIHKFNEINAAPDKVEDNTQVVPGEYEIFRDLKFQNGFYVTGMDSASEGSHTPYIFNYGDSSKKPTWRIAQWDSKYDFCDDSETIMMQPEDGVFVYDNPSKTVTVNTNTGEIGLKLTASAVYSSARKAGERWPHLLIEDGGLLAGSQNKFANKLKNVNQLRLQLKQKLSFFEDKMGSTADSALHAASMYIYLYVKGTNSKGQNEMMWFGVPLFDSRSSFPGEYGAADSGKSDASGLFAYNVPSKAYTNTTFFKNNKPFGSNDNAWMNIDIDLLPYIQRAINLANENGQMEGVTLDTAYIDGVNLGWEMPGTYDAEMLIKDLSLKSYVGTSYTNTTGIQSVLGSQMDDNNQFTLNDRISMNIPKNVIEIDGFATSMLIAKSIKMENNVNISGISGAALETFDNDLMLNGVSYIYDYNNPITMTFKVSDSDLKAAGNDIANLKFYNYDAVSGSKTELKVKSYDASTKTATFEMTRLQTFVVWNTKAAANTASGNTDSNTKTPNTGDNINAITILAAFAILSTGLLVIRMKPSKNHVK